jgi:hypothetical protein
MKRTTIKIAIFDLDNCLADDRHRLKLIDYTSIGSQRYEEYHDKCYSDRMPEDCAKVVGKYFDDGFKILFITARPNNFRTKTLEWLRENFDKHLINIGQLSLWMRAEGDTQPAVEVKRLIVQSLPEYYSIDIANSVAFDDREDVVEMYRKYGYNAKVMRIYDPVEFRDAYRQVASVATTSAVSEICDQMKSTFEERNAVYKDNYKMVPQLVKVLFPNGVPPELVVTDQWHLFELKLVKLTRFAISGLTHKDSIHDDAVYSVLIESIIKQQENK